jgi:hypothetical protein
VKWPLNSIVQRLGVALAVLPAIACDGPTDVVCTKQFATYTVVVTDTARAPVSGATLVVTVRRTGATLTPQSFFIYAAGTYVLLDDGARAALRETGDEVHAVASGAHTTGRRPRAPRRRRVHVDAARSWASAVGIRGGRIVYVDGDSLPPGLVGPATKVVHLAGRMVLPGFQDGHRHVSSPSRVRRSASAVPLSHVRATGCSETVNRCRSLNQEIRCEHPARYSPSS